MHPLQSKALIRVQTRFLQRSTLTQKNKKTSSNVIVFCEEGEGEKRKEGGGDYDNDDNDDDEEDDEEDEEDEDDEEDEEDEDEEDEDEEDEDEEDEEDV